MIISRTPFRISFFGGGTDYPRWFRQHGGAVLSTTINKYCYLTVRHLPPFFEHKYRIVYSQVELTRKIEEIKHPAIRGILGESGLTQGLEIHHDADLPARSGLGSSSAFVVGFIHALQALRGRMIAKPDLAQAAVRMEQEVLRENVGCQDQMSATWGGLNRFDFRPDGTIDVSPVILPRSRLEELERSILLCFTGRTRIASDIALRTIENLDRRADALHRVQAMVGDALAILQDPREPMRRLGELMDESWRLKRGLAEAISTPEIDAIYQAAREAGASGGKLMGAGGGGFMVFIVDPEHRARLRERLRHLVQVDVSFEQSGSRIVLYDPENGEG